MQLNIGICLYVCLKCDSRVCLLLSEKNMHRKSLKSSYYYKHGMISYVEILFSFKNYPRLQTKIKEIEIGIWNYFVSAMFWKLYKRRVCSPERWYFLVYHNDIGVKSCPIFSLSLKCASKKIPGQWWGPMELLFLGLKFGL